MEVLNYTDEVLELRPRLWRIFLIMGLVFVLVGFAVFFFLGQVASLDCSRIEAGTPDCHLTQSLLGFTIKEQHIEKLIDARVVENRDSDGDATYKIILETREGNIPLSTYTSSGKQNMMNIVAEITTFLQKSQEQSLSVHYGGRSSQIMPLVFLLVGLVEVIFGILARKSVWQFNKSENLATHYRQGLSGMRVSQYTLDEITDAMVTSSRDSDGDRTYRIDLITKSGELIPMTSWYSSGYDRKQETAVLIREFITPS